MIIGSSFVSRTEAFCKRVDRALCLPSKPRWCGKPGLTLHRTKAMLDKHLSPEGKGILILHVGANSIGAVSSREWMRQLQEVVYYCRLRFRHYKIVWSDMVRRNKWRHLPDDESERLRKRLQQRARALFYEEKGGVIRHHALNRDDSMLSQDNVHLNLMGQEWFLYDIWSYFQ